MPTNDDRPGSPDDFLAVSVRDSRNRMSAKAFAWIVDDHYFVLVAWRNGEMAAYIEDAE